MQHDQKQLHQIAQDYPWHTFTVEEIAILCNVSRDVVTRVRMAEDSPFFLNKCRPEWFLQWMRDHPEFQLSKASPSSAFSSAEDDEDIATHSERILKVIVQRRPKPSGKHRACRK